MTKKIEEISQYNQFAEDFSSVQSKSNASSRDALYGRLPETMSGLNVLDLGCGDGSDLAHCQSLGAVCYGVDASEEILAIAKQKIPTATLVAASFQSIPFADEKFDQVISKYAIQTVDDVDIVFQEVHRVLKRGGRFLCIVVHPLRQFIEKKYGGKDYYKKEVVNSVLFGGKITVKEPVHAMTEYLSNFMLRNFDLIHYEEIFDPDAEQVDEQIYPGFLMMEAVKS